MFLGEVVAGVGVLVRGFTVMMSGGLMMGRCFPRPAPAAFSSAATTAAPAVPATASSPPAKPTASSARRCRRPRSRHGRTRCPNCLAGKFEGDVDVTGTLTAAVKHFRIDDPIDPANKYLVHTAVESSEMKNIYDGTVVLDPRGTATVALPAWFEAENGDFRYQLTADRCALTGALYRAQDRRQRVLDRRRCTRHRGVVASDRSAPRSVCARTSARCRTGERCASTCRLSSPRTLWRWGLAPHGVRLQRGRAARCDRAAAL
jgi:hypothetical protein